jgi:multidrug transporter EmrE-like cation transporter
MLLLLVVLFDLAGCTLTKWWSLPNGSNWHLVGGCICFLLDMTFWMSALSNGVSMAKATIFLAVTSCVIGVAVGVGFGESLSVMNWVGVALGITAVAMLAT